MIYLLLILGFVAVFYGRSLVDKWQRYKHKKQLSALVPGDEGIPVFGNLFELGRNSETMPKCLLERAAAAREQWDGQILKFWVMHDCVFMPFTGEMLQSIIESNDEINKGVDYDIFVPWLGRGLLLAGGDKWRSRRKMINPSFHFAMLNEYTETMNQHAKVLLNVLESHTDKEFDIYPFMKRCTLDAICDIAMAKDLDSLHNPDQPYVKAIHKIMFLGVEASMKPQLWFGLGRMLTGWQKEHDENVKFAHDLTNQVIAERTELLERGEAEVNKKAFLDMLLSEKERSNLSMEDIREEVDTFMFAGHDTTSATLGWTIWCLANHPEIQQNAYEEIKSIFGDDDDRYCSKDELPKLEYLERCIKEALRVFPSVPFTLRYLEEDLQTGPYLLPRGSTLAISPFLVHRNDRIYPDPLVYDPDRFLPEKVATRHPHDFIPFSAGPRNCIGQKFAMYQLKIILSWILRRYRLESNRPFHSNRLLADVVLKSGDGINVLIRAR